MAKLNEKIPRHIVLYTMSRIRSKGTGLELIFKKALESVGIPFAMHYNILGKPDFVIIDSKIAIFCDSDFWHGFDWDHKKINIKSNKDYWIPKIERNILRAKIVNAKLRKMGWSVLRFWEHEIYTDINDCLEKTIKKIIDKE